MTYEEVIEIDSYEPDYSKVCDVCETSPVVTCVRDGEVTNTSDMCGPCTFGTAKAIDPEWWNKSDD